jgi:hypothetical protein
MAEKRSYRIVTFFNAKERMDDQFNDWYNDHVVHALQVPGMLTGQRFQLSQQQREGSTPQWQYLAFYEIETDDLQAVIDDLHVPARMPPGMVGTNTIAPGGQVMFFEPITDKMTSK